MRISDWSSDVCAADLSIAGAFAGVVRIARQQKHLQLSLEFLDTIFADTHFVFSHGFQFGIRHHFQRRVDIGFDTDIRAKHLDYRSEEHTSELQSLMRTSYAVFCLKKTKIHTHIKHYKSHQN